MNYRKLLENYEQDDAVEEAEGILDDIESRVFDILDSIQGIEGLSEIDDLKENLDKLYRDLF